jgi:hypothetical protein
LSSLLAEKFADILTGNDVLELFKRLEESLGSLRKAASRCDLQRKTIYDWERTRNLKLPTKRKVLRTLLETNTEETLEYMVKRSSETTVELLSTYLTTLCECAAEPDIDQAQFQFLMERFERVREENASIIVDKLETEVANMLSILENRAVALKTSYESHPPRVAKLAHLAMIMPTVMSEIHKEYPFSGGLRLSRQLNLPLEFVDSVSRSVGELVSIYQRPEAKITLPNPIQHVAGASASEQLDIKYTDQMPLTIAT